MMQFQGIYILLRNITIFILQIVLEVEAGASGGWAIDYIRTSVKTSCPSKL